MKQTRMPIPKADRPKPPAKRGFQTPEDVEQALADYKQWCIDNPVPIGTKGRTTPTPMTWVGFAVFCGRSRTSLYRMEVAHDLADAFQHVRDTIEASLVAQGLTRSVDGNLVARVAGISDKQEVKTTDATPGATDYDFSKLTDAEMETLQELLEKAAISS